MMKLLAALAILGTNLYAFYYLGSDEVIPPRSLFSTFPDQLDDWQCARRETLEKSVVNNLGVTDYISCAFYGKQPREAAHLYVGYHERQTRDRESGKAQAIHPPEHCLPGSGWDIIDSSIVPLRIGAGGEAKRFIIAKGNNRSLVYFWYHSRGRILARSHEKILYMFLDRATKGRSDGSLVRFTVPIYNGDVEQAEAVFHRFADRVTPLLPAYVPD
jgi:EpsI family protein